MVRTSLLALASEVYDEIDAVKSIHVHSKPVDMTVATFDKIDCLYR